MPNAYQNSVLTVRFRRPIRVLCWQFSSEGLSEFCADSSIPKAYQNSVLTVLFRRPIRILCWQFYSEGLSEFCADSSIPKACQSSVLTVRFRFGVRQPLYYVACYLAGAPAQRRVGADRAVNDGLPVDVSAILLVEYWHGNFSQNISDAFGV